MQTEEPSVCLQACRQKNRPFVLYEAKHLVIAQLVDRIEIRKNDGYDITIHWRMTAEQFLGRKTEASA